MHIRQNTLIILGTDRDDGEEQGRRSHQGCEQGQAEAYGNGKLQYLLAWVYKYYFRAVAEK